MQVIDINSFIKKSYMTKSRSTSFTTRSRYILAKLLASSLNYDIVLPSKTNCININVSIITNNVPDKDFCPPADVSKSSCTLLGNNEDYCPQLGNGEDYCPQSRGVYRAIDFSKVKSNLNC